MKLKLTVEVDLDAEAADEQKIKAEVIEYIKETLADFFDVNDIKIT